jgi:8-oxo-dGTP pyrophosphatase MutT (NUDIX family)
MTEIVRIKRLELAVAPRPWPFADAHREEIARHFEELRESKPAVWNGRILLLHDHAIAGDVFRGGYLETDYASFVAWRDWGFPDATVRNCFSLGALRACDGGFLLGVMSGHTLNAGKIYFPAGTPDPVDIVDGMVDLAGSIWREMAEETGLAPDAYQPEDTWACVPTSTHIALIKVLQARETATVLRERILDHLAREAAPELSDIRIVRGPADFDPMMPLFVPTFLNHVWGQASKGAR